MRKKRAAQLRNAASILGGYLDAQNRRFGFVNCNVRRLYRALKREWVRNHRFMSFDDLDKEHVARRFTYELAG